jgi:hypothetical protein
MAQHQTQTDIPRESLGELLSELATTSAALVRDQIELAKEEMRENLARLRSGFVALAFGAVISMFALGTLCAAAVIGLGMFIGILMSALAVGLGLVTVGAIIISVGIRRLKHARLKPKQTVQSLKESKEWLKDMT